MIELPELHVEIPLRCVLWRAPKRYTHKGRDRTKRASKECERGYALVELDLPEPDYEQMTTYDHL